MRYPPANRLCEPEARLVRDLAPEFAVTDAICWFDQAAAADMRWAVTAVRAPDAWKLPNGTGKMAVAQCAAVVSPAVVRRPPSVPVLESGHRSRITFTSVARKAH